MNKFLMSVALLTAATLTVHAAGKPGNGGNHNGNGSNSSKGNVSNGNHNGGNNSNSNSNSNKNDNKQGKNDNNKNQNDNKQGKNDGPKDKDAKQSNGPKDHKMQVLDPKVTTKNYHLTNGKKFDFGFCYKNFHHDHWSHRCFFDQYGCNCNWCPCSNCWYYWCGWDSCWYPVTYCPYGRYVF